LSKTSHIAIAPETWLAVGSKYRRPGALDYLKRCEEDPTIEALRDRVANWEGGLLWLGGCEPTLRHDLPELLRGIAGVYSGALGMWTDGLALQSEPIIRGLIDCGIGRVRLPFHAGRPDAHDWITGMKGSSRRATRAIRLCIEAGLEVEVETVVSRPTMTLLQETVGVAKRLGARGIHLRMPRCQGEWEQRYVALSARYGLIHPYLSELKSSSQCLITLRGVPQCVVPDNLVYMGVRPEHWLCSGAIGAPLSGGECAQCAAHPACSGPPEDYVKRFGWYEIHSESNQLVAASPKPIPLEQGAVKPPPRAGRAPATRVRFSAIQARRASLGGDPLVGLSSRPVPDSIRVTFGGPAPVADPVLGDHSEGEPVESTRVIRRRLVELSQEGSRLLRVASAGSLAHPQAGELLAECRRLSIEAVEVCGIGSCLSGLSDREIRRLRGIDRFYFALYGPVPEQHDRVVGEGSFVESLAIGSRISELIKAEVGYFGVLRGAEQLPGFEQCWKLTQGMGKPRFRLGPKGGSLRSLADALEDCSKATREALLPMIPPCLVPRSDANTPALPAEEAFGDIGTNRRKPSACDVRGSYNKCPHASECMLSSFCPGLAQGWSTEGIEPVGEDRNE
jgi:MoaA/NifB/PqqE/SkfB family radical SAM enzyme